MSDILLRSCPTNWEYEDKSNHDVTLTGRKTFLLTFLRSYGASHLEKFAVDTRPIHAYMFKDLTPEGFEYFAGHYRGENLRCLNNYEVGINGDNRVGHPAATIPMEMQAFSLKIDEAIVQLDFHYNVPNSIFSPAQKLLRAIEIVAAVFVYFLEIHPYANGNGHMGRWLLMTMLGRHNVYFDANFDLHPRPNEPAYSHAIVQYRNNNKAPLHLLLMNCI